MKIKKQNCKILYVDFKERMMFKFYENYQWPAKSQRPLYVVFDDFITVDAQDMHEIEARHIYRAMHFSAKRSIAIACRLSVRLSVCDVGGL